MIRAFFAITAVIVMPLLVSSQQQKDTIPPATKLVVSDTSGKVIEKVPVNIDSARIKDSADRARNRPRKAALRSAILPGWGQVYNKKYWKVPLVAAAVGIPAWLVYYNQEWYKRTSFAVRVADAGNNLPIFMDQVDPELRALVKAGRTSSLINYRNEFRRNRDYAILFGLLFWGLNVIDATVDAHLKGFDVSDDISLHIKPAILPGNAAGVSLVFNIGKTHPKAISSLR